MLNKLLFLGLALWVSASFAQQNPCGPDIQKFCKDELQKKGDIVGCLQKNIQKASDSCKAHDKKMREVVAAVPMNCHPDFKKYCSSFPSKALVLDCLKENKKNLAVECSKELEALK